MMSRYDGSGPAMSACEGAGPDSTITSLFIAGSWLHPVSVTEITSIAAQVTCRKGLAVPNCLLVLNPHILQRLSAAILITAKTRERPIDLGVAARAPTLCTSSGRRRNKLGFSSTGRAANSGAQTQAVLAP